MDFHEVSWRVEAPPWPLLLPPPLLALGLGALLTLACVCALVWFCWMLLQHRVPPAPAPRSRAQRRCLAGEAQPAILSDQKTVIKSSDLSEEMEKDAMEYATRGLEKYYSEKDIAAHIVKGFDKKYNPTWHCIVGRDFVSSVTLETEHFIYFYLGQVAILLFKTG